MTDGWKYHLTVMESLRPRFWYVVVARCGAEMDGAIEFSYQLSFYNKVRMLPPRPRRGRCAHASAAQGTSHLSCEDEGILATCSLFLVVWAAATALQFYGVNSSRQQGERLHPVIALLTSTMTLETVSLALFSLHWLVYTGNGIGLVDAKTFAQCAFHPSAPYAAQASTHRPAVPPPLQSSPCSPSSPSPACSCCWPRVRAAPMPPPPPTKPHSSGCPLQAGP